MGGITPLFFDKSLQMFGLCKDLDFYLTSQQYCDINGKKAIFSLGK